MDTKTTVASTSNVNNTEDNAEGSSSINQQKYIVNWADDTDMNLDNTNLTSGGNFKNTLLTLNPFTAKDAEKHQLNSSAEKGKMLTILPMIKTSFKSHI